MPRYWKRWKEITCGKVEEGCTFHRINYKDVSKPEKALEIGTCRIRAKNEAYSLTEK